MSSHAATRLPHAIGLGWKVLRSEFGFGGLSGVALFLWSHQYLATFGTSHAVTSALAVALGAALLLGFAGRGRVASSRFAAWVAPAAWLTIAGWTVTFAWQLAAGRLVLGLVPMATMTSEAVVFGVMLCIACCLFVLPIAACLTIGESLRRSNSTASGAVGPSMVLGAAVGLTAGPSVLAPVLGLGPLMIGIAAIAAVGFWRGMTQALESDRAAVSIVPVPVRFNPWAVGLSLLVGLQVPVMARLALGLMPGSPFEHDAVWSGLVGGIACGLMWGARASRRGRSVTGSDGPLVAAMIATIWPIAMLSVWGLLVDGFLTINASVSTVPLIMLLRMTMAGLATAPLGIALGRVWSPQWNDSPSRPGDSRQLRRSGPASDAARLGESCNSPATCILSLVAGVVVMRSVAVPPVMAVAALAIVAMMIAVARYWVLGLPVLTRRQQLAGAGVVLTVAVLPVVSGNYRPDVAAKLLFSTNTFTALQSGISRDLLPQLDDSRLVAMAQGRDATWTVWKHRGSQLSLRENGLPRGVVSTDPFTSPQYAGEVMPAIVPMVLHTRPQSVLMLGLGSTAPLTSVLACPVASVTCVEADADLIGLSRQMLVPSGGVHPLDDDRVRLLNIDPTLALLARGQQHDVLIVNEAQPSVMGAASGFTTEFYRAARHSLHDDGLLCQRLQYADFGGGPIVDLLATIQAVFPHVALFDAAPGEMLLIATAKDGPLVDEGIIDRCETPHIRNLMAQVGWDWSVLMNLGAISPDGVAELTQQDGTPNTVGNGRFAFGLPQEVMRWSSPQLPKWRERQQLLSVNGSRMLAWIGDSERVKEVRQRLADVIEQQRLIAEHPDQFWAYRKTLKERLKERPRGVVQQVKHEGLKRTLHPEDERRKQYLEVLGEAATSDAPDAEAIRALTEFAVPYDPLVSHFLHQEAARLYEKSAEDDPAARFHHLRYSVYFGPPNDQSVRNVVAALALLNEQPELISDSLARWDEMNSLLEILKLRSSLRLHADASASSFELIDAERSIRIAKRTMAAMDDLREQTNVPADDWQHRKTVLERMLVRPMWTYHSQQAARLAKHHAQSAALHAERESETETK